MNNTRYIRFAPNVMSRYNKELYGFIITRVVNRPYEYEGVSFHTDGTSFRCQVDDNPDLGNNEEEHEVTTLEFLVKLPSTHS